MDKMCYKIFHIPGDGESWEERESYFNLADSHISKHIAKLDTPTIKIGSYSDYARANRMYSLPFLHKEFKFGEVGIWASNLVAMKNFLKTDYEYLMLMEDDISLEPEFIDLLKEYMEELPDSWEVFSYFVHSNQFGRFNESTHIGKNVVLAYQDWSMLCYIIKRSTALKILQNTEYFGVDAPIDHYIFRQPDVFKSYTLHPNAKVGCSLLEVISTFQKKESEELIMGYSDPVNKPYAIEKIKEINPKKVLDVGSGMGIYYDLIKGNLEGDIWIDGLEVWEPYIEEFKLIEKYDGLYMADVREHRNFDYDLVIFGDVLEHMSEEDAIAVWERTSQQARYGLISIPIKHYPQEGINNNPYEVHVEEDWSTERVLQKFSHIVEYKEFPETGVFIAKFDKAV